jgi:uncharacterized protein YggE
VISEKEGLTMKAILSACVMLFATAVAAHADITITGTSKVKFTPDIAYLTVGTSTDGKTASEAWKKNVELVKKLFARLKELGVPEKDLQTSNVNISARYVYPKDEPAQLVGYTASYDLTITARKLSEIGKLLDSAVNCGANKRMGIRFECSDPEKLLDKARVGAIAEARRKAEIYARGAGAKLRTVKSIVEGNYSPYRTYRFEYAPAMALKDNLPIAAGEHELSVSVTVTWTLDNAPEESIGDNGWRHKKAAAVKALCDQVSTRPTQPRSK